MEVPVRRELPVEACCHVAQFQIISSICLLVSKTISICLRENVVKSEKYLIINYSAIKFCCLVALIKYTPFCTPVNSTAKYCHVKQSLKPGFTAICEPGFCKNKWY